MENELGHNDLDTTFTGTSAQESTSDNDECCGNDCGCHD